ncbi:MAG: carboxylating nicotinate-nucleotide diphosphorylase [Dehalococcoidia bacterium]|nr:carboxylating nicotinate-nucleotide diphosphorylase [Chloroflexota bacterium]MCZ6866882.1 carboxylating nicotinate-nucleotide diphosphorylase [Chloroflexota bacterium]
MLEVTPEVQHLIDLALAEDQVFNDATTSALIRPNVWGVGTFHAKAHGILAGLDVALAVFHRVEPSVETEALMQDGHGLEPGSTIARVAGKASTILRGERTALNILQRMSGIATETARYVKAVEGYRVKIVDTRKTAPGLRYLDKHAVRVGGGHNHRMNLADGVLIKDNHIELLRHRGMTLPGILEQAREMAPHTLKIEVEVTNLAELEEVLEGGAHIIMLDNMSLEDMSKAVEMVGGRALVEASGGITLENVAAVAETGVDLISVGALTHSVTALDISLDIAA